MQTLRLGPNYIHISRLAMEDGLVSYEYANNSLPCSRLRF
jgi:hypothetical protein